MLKFKKNHPIIIGFSGKAGSGKTSVAEKIVPKGAIEASIYGMKWDHIFYALPLYEMVTIKRSIKGISQDSRQLFALHSVLFDLYGGSPIGRMPEYHDFYNRVKTIQELYIESEGIKPRSFLQNAGDICKEDFPNCFSDWAISKANNLYRLYLKTLEEDDDEDVPYAVIISDVRYLNEAKKILEQPNGIIVSFDASEETLNNRLIKRDGKVMDKNLSIHSSEQEIDLIKEISTYIINTDNMSVEDQVSATIDLLKKEKVFYA